MTAINSREHPTAFASAPYDHRAGSSARRARTKPSRLVRALSATCPACTASR